MPISGQWLATQDMQFYPDLSNRATPPPTPDPEHARPSNAVQNPSWKAPQYQGGMAADPEAPTVIGLEAFDLPENVPILDQTPKGHQVVQSHNVENHAVGYDHNSYQFFNEHWYGVEVEGTAATPITEGAKPAYVRGINSADVNNPAWHGYRSAGGRYLPGVYRWTNINRDFAPPRRQHDFRYVRPDVVTIIGDAPPPTKPNQYSSPFSSLQRFRSDIKMKPMQRRIPAPFDEDLIYDGSSAPPQAPVDPGGW